MGARGELGSLERGVLEGSSAPPNGGCSRGARLPSNGDQSRSSHPRARKKRPPGVTRASLTPPAACYYGASLSGLGTYGKRFSGLPSTPRSQVRGVLPHHVRHRLHGPQGRPEARPRRGRFRARPAVGDPGVHRHARRRSPGSAACAGGSSCARSRTSPRSGCSPSRPWASRRSCCCPSASASSSART